MVEGRAILEAIFVGVGIASEEDEPVGDIAGAVKMHQVADAGVAEAKAEVVGVVAVVGVGRKGQGAHGGVAAVAGAVNPDLPGAIALVGLQPACGVEEVDDVVAAEVAVVEGGKVGAEAA